MKKKKSSPASWVTSSHLTDRSRKWAVYTLLNNLTSTLFTFSSLPWGHGAVIPALSTEEEWMALCSHHLMMEQQWTMLHNWGIWHPDSSKTVWEGKVKATESRQRSEVWSGLTLCPWFDWLQHFDFSPVSNNAHRETSFSMTSSEFNNGVVKWFIVTQNQTSNWQRGSIQRSHSIKCQWHWMEPFHVTLFHTCTFIRFY